MKSLKDSWKEAVVIEAIEDSSSGNYIFVIILVYFLLDETSEVHVEISTDRQCTHHTTDAIGIESMILAYILCKYFNS